MLLHRIFPRLDNASIDEVGGPEYLHPHQGAGRWDNPSEYLCWYLADSASGAVGEVFGQLETWTDAMFDFPAVPGARRALGTYSLPDDVALLDFDDPNALAERALRPTQIVSANRLATQKIALDVHNEAEDDGSPRWQGISWWSFYRSSWPVHCIWGAAPKCESVEDLEIDHVAVRDAANTLSKLVR